MKISGKIVGANIDFKTNKPILMLEVNERKDFAVAFKMIHHQVMPAHNST